MPTTTKLYYNSFVPAFSNIGVAIPESKLYFFLTGTNTLAPLWADAAATVALANPVSANLAGKYVNIYLDSNVIYRVVQTDKNNVTIGDEVDPYIPGQALKGDPGGDVSAVGLFVDIDTITIPSGIELISTSGHTTRLRGRATYSRHTGAALPAWGNGIWWTTSADGAVWQLETDAPRVSQFGAVNDGVRAFATVTATGTDNLAFFHFGINWCFIKNVKALYVDTGNYFVSNTVHLGGMLDTWHSVELRATVEAPFPIGAYNGQIWPQARILTNFNDRPCINIQSSRGAGVYGLIVEGPIFAHINNNNLGAINCAIDDRLEAAWHPAIANSSFGRYNSGAGITVDAYSGTDSGASSYPDPVYPTHYAAKAAPSWGQRTSSEVTIRGGGMFGFSAGVILSPSGNDLQGDFLRVSDIQILACIYGVSVCNSQSRNVEISNLNWARVHTVVTNNTHGNQTGRFGGPLVNGSGGLHIRLFSYSSGAGGGLIFDNFYWEAGWRFGDAVGTTGAGIVLRNVQAGNTLATYNTFRGIPQNHYGSSATATTFTTVPITIEGESEVSDLSVLVFNASTVNFKGGFWNPTNRGGTSVSAARAIWNNSLAGGIVHMGDIFSESGLLEGSGVIAPNVYPRYLNSGTFDAWSRFDGFTNINPTRTRGTPIYAKELSYPSSRMSVPARARNHRYFNTGATLTGAGGASFSRTGRLITWTLPTGFGVFEERFNFKAGDGFVHSSGVVGYIYSWDNATRTLKAQIENGFNGPVNSETLFAGIDLLGGNYIFYSGRLSVPNLPLFGDFSASTTVANVRTGDLSTGGFNSQISVGDRLFVSWVEDGVWTTDNIGDISGVSDATPSLTLSVAATGVARRRIIIRPHIASQINP